MKNKNHIERFEFTLTEDQRKIVKDLQQEAYKDGKMFVIPSQLILPEPHYGEEEIKVVGRLMKGKFAKDMAKAVNEVCRDHDKYKPSDPQMDLFKAK